MTGFELTFLAVGVVAMMAIVGGMFTLYEMSLMRQHPEEFPKTYKNLHPDS